MSLNITQTRAMSDIGIPLLLPLVDAVTTEDVHVDGRLLGILVTPSTPHFDASDRRVVLEFHGGGLTIGSARLECSVAARWAHRLNTRYFTVEYRMMPEHTVEQSVEDGVAAYEYLLKQGYPASKIILTGCSAGGAMTVLTLAGIVRRGLPAPQAAVICSVSNVIRYLWKPYEEWESFANRDVDTLPYAWYRHIMTDLVDRNPENAAFIRDLLADFSGFPPALIVAGDLEFLRDGSKYLADRLRSVGVPVEYFPFKYMSHCNYIESPILVAPETQETSTFIGDYMKRQWARS